MTRMEDLPVEDRAAIEDFAAFLRGESACLVCMTPTAQCGRHEGEPCCPTCVHGRIQRTEGPPRIDGGARPYVVIRERRPQ